MRLLDGSSAAVVGSIDLPPTNAGPMYGRAIAEDPQANRVYVGDSYLGTIASLDGATNSLVSAMSVQSPVYALAANPTTNRLYAAIFNE